ncbi:hypothetical protein [Leifsonia sp. A12D58]|uniref:hypothetical protein n=1 Tax=Leifsonia sp. A12D58 TaxID=3397674 RepID=UPI0039DF8FE9
MNDHDLTRTLKALDIAPKVEGDDATKRRTDARKEQILLTPILEQAPTQSSTSRRRWPLAVAGLAAAAVTGLVLTGALTPAPAYASWTVVPTSVTTNERTIAGAACIEAAGTPGAEVVLAERRGDWIGIAAVTDDFKTATCLLYLPVGATQPEHVMAGSTGGEGATPIGGEFTEGSITEFSERGLFGLGASPAAAFNIGDVGSDVTAVSITTADGDLVHATVDDGRFIAWWPGHAFGEATEGNGGPAPDLKYSLTLTDGTVMTDAQPVLPE